MSAGPEAGRREVRSERRGDRRRRLGTLAAALLLLFFVVAVADVYVRSARLREDLREAVGLRVTIDDAAHALQTHDPGSPAIEAALREIEGATDLAEGHLELREPAVTLRRAVGDLRASLRGDPSSAGPTDARQEVFVRGRELTTKLRGRSGRISRALDGAWTRMQGLALSSIGLAVLVLLLVLLEQRQARLRGELADRLEHALVEAEAARSGALSASRAKSEFLATISHELRTPLTAVIGTLDLLSRTQLDRHQREYLAVVGAGSEAVLRLVSDVLDFSRIEAGRLELNLSDVDLYAVLDELALLFAGPAEQKGLALSVVVDGDVPTVLHTDGNRLRQVLVNLVGNSVKFTERGEVAVRVHRHSGHLSIIVRDTGPGVPEELRSRLFAPFEQGVPARVVGGSGLGLAISRRLAGAMGGSVVLKSAPGEGAVFEVELPLSSATEARSLRAGRPFATKGDDPWVQAATEQLKAWGFPVVPLAQAEIVLVGRDAAAPETGVRIRMLPLAADAGPTDLPGPVRPGALRTLLWPDVERAARPMAGTIARRVLVVDDQATNRRVLAEMLGHIGHLADVAPDGVAGVERARAEAYDLVLMDVDMPDLDGLAATRALREDGGASAGAVIVGLSGHATEQARHAGLDAGMDAWVSKPVRLDDLRTALQVPRRSGDGG